MDGGTGSGGDGRMRSQAADRLDSKYSATRRWLLRRRRDCGRGQRRTTKTAQQCTIEPPAAALDALRTVAA